ncbi:tetratricopeptide repeat protein [Candidatus Methylopumilus rimovensis]|uniref:Ancillary SecYEG translocon subunit n=1 Tax=Candidatus Methylopumilus rimovensis TaxID=2588535 RepID=A0AAE6FSU0_9PROT|nr:tetratricopeptide repeat protein [Candidatus Methylopumilus rimovensis]QDD13398.1 tetratricopeptide repeat protein [Candidatus Methylopumilus rimovensis]
MALDLEEQEQVDELKALWKKYGTYITRGAIAFFVLYGLFQGWGYYQNKQSLNASEAYQSIVVLDEKNTKEIMQKAESLMDNYGGTPYAGRAAILFAKASYAEGSKDKAKEKLEWASRHAKESATESIALIQLGQVLLEEKKYEEALKKANDVDNEGYLGLANDLKGDALSAMGKKEDAKKAYLEALKRFGPKDPYAKFTQEKLETLGV